MAVRSPANLSRGLLTRGCPYLTCRLPCTLVVCQTAPRLTNASCYSRYQGIPTLLSTLAVTGRYQLSLTMRRSTTLSDAVQGLMSHKYTPGDTNTPVNTAERLTLIQRQPYRLCRTYRLFSFRLTLHTEDSLSIRQQQRSFNDRSVIFTQTAMIC